MNPKPAKNPRASAVKKVPAKHKAVLRYTYPIEEGWDLMRDGSYATCTVRKKPFRIYDLPYYLLPATPEAYEAQVEAMAKAMRNKSLYNSWEQDAVQQLASIGIRQPRPARSRK